MALSSMHAFVILLIMIMPSGFYGLRIHTNTQTQTHQQPKFTHDATFCNQHNEIQWTGSKCPDAKWVDAMVQNDPKPGKVILNIGCNKGQDAIQWLERWDSNKFYSTHAWMQTLDKKYPEAQGYFCPPDESFVKAPSFVAQNQGNVSRDAPTVVCADALRANVDMLKAVAHELGYADKGEKGAFHVVYGAFARENGGTVDIPDAEPGYEKAGIGSGEQVPMIPTPLRSVDSLVEELRIPKVDILSIDTEGADPDVVKGATQTLTSLRYLEFEVHRDLKNTAWHATSLRSVIEDLDDKGFDCYFAGNNGKLLSVQRCWKDKYDRTEVIPESGKVRKPIQRNVACVKRGDEWAGIMAAFHK